MDEFPKYYEASNPPEWATLAPSRSPEFKLHNTKGLAKSAIAGKKPVDEIALYHLEVVDGKPVWVKRWAYTYPEICPECGGGFQASSSFRNYYKYNLPYDYEGTVMDAQVICERCYNDQRLNKIQRQKEAQEREAWERLNRKYGENVGTE